jgi:hypothetical protein
MIRHRWTLWGALLCALVVARPVGAAPIVEGKDKPLSQVPATAPIVIQVRGLERTRERLNVLIKKAMPDYADLAKEKMDEAYKKALDGRELKAIPKDGAIFLVFTELPAANQNPPKMAILVPVSNYETFRNALLKEDERKSVKADPAGFETVSMENETVYFVNRKSGYVAITPNADVAATFAKKIDGLDGKLSKSAAGHLMESDLSVYVNMVTVNKEHGDAIKQFQSTFESAIDAAPDKAIAEMAKRILTPLVQAVSDSTAVVMSADLRPEGLLLRAEVEVLDDSKTNGLLTIWKSLPVADISKLPSGEMAYSGIAWTPDLLKKIGALAAGLVADQDSKEGKAIEKAMTQMADAKPGEQVSTAGTGKTGLSVWKFDDPAKAVDAQLQLFKSLKEGSMYGAVLKADPKVKENAEKYGGFALHSVSMKWDLEKTIEKQGGAALANDEQKKAMVELMRSLLGEGSNIWFGTDGKTMVQVTAKDWDAARKYLDRYQKGDGTVGQSQAFKDTVKHLPADASMIALMDVPQYSEVFVKGVVLGLQSSGLVPVPPGSDKPAIKAKTTYMGVGMRMDSGRARFDMWLSAQSVNDVYKMYIERLLKPNF